MTSPPAPCPRPDCAGGAVMVTGFCDTCHRRPPEKGRTAPARPAAVPEAPARRPAEPAADALDNDGLLILPHIPSPEPSEAAPPTA
ncbi:protein kinase, partial [Streptomyces bobili]